MPRARLRARRSAATHGEQRPAAMCGVRPEPRAASVVPTC